MHAILVAGGVLLAAAAVPLPTVAEFQKLEQALMDAVAAGDKAVWERTLADEYVLTSEEGEVLPKAELLEGMSGLPPGLKGRIAVRDLTVQDAGDTAVVRYLADEWESVFGQEMTTKYRVTDVFRRGPQGWRAIASHTSVITQDPPAQPVSKAGWAGLAGTYRLLPDGWTLTVELRDGTLYGGRDPAKLRPFVPMTDQAFVLTGSLGEWLFVVEDGKATRIVNLRKFEPLTWTRVDAKP